MMRCELFIETHTKSDRTTVNDKANENNPKCKCCIMIS